MQFGGLADRVRAERTYQSALSVARGRMLISEERLMNLYLLLTCFVGRLGPVDSVVEFGSYRGGTALFMASVLGQVKPTMKVFALDTFEGMPAVDRAVDAHSAGDFSDADLPGLKRRILESGLHSLCLVQGRFEETAGAALAGAGRVALVHIDADIASAVRYAYEQVRRFMAPGGYIVFDDATVSSCIGATEVVEDTVIRRDGLNSEQIWPHYVFREPMPGWTRA